MNRRCCFIKASKARCAISPLDAFIVTRHYHRITPTPAARQTATLYHYGPGHTARTAIAAFIRGQEFSLAAAARRPGLTIITCAAAGDDGSHFKSRRYYAASMVADAPPRRARVSGRVAGTGRESHSFHCCHFGRYWRGDVTFTLADDFRDAQTRVAGRRRRRSFAAATQCREYFLACRRRRAPAADAAGSIGIQVLRSPPESINTSRMLRLPAMPPQSRPIRRWHIRRRE